MRLLGLALVVMVLAVPYTAAAEGTSRAQCTIDLAEPTRPALYGNCIPVYKTEDLPKLTESPAPSWLEGSGAYEISVTVLSPDADPVVECEPYCPPTDFTVNLAADTRSFQVNLLILYD